MNHRGIEYSLVQMITPVGWRWSFEYLGNEFSGIGQTRHEAIRAAHRAIDNLLQLRPIVHN
jgi:hypothetical protein